CARDDYWGRGPDYW
nr:immunoglobulin heavy chain junction region [Macaca mulatta]MOX14598.1 immunoglobulin heavy chain junction region [Macaca mulatta]MOX14637.1 immunoglobulin heavy chain junction region [Macaca mulatta]MOX14642.1 immunoglobulin heavy chain junction region [Macaca mulatta]MOX14658.1 immunoglobulin heavy chain junction region [Macaca mulatta]